ncbi:hypothetical protein OROGR_006397 [Orobanche gracilis]
MATDDTSRPRGLPVDKVSYLVIEADGGYSISHEPKEFPQDVNFIKVYEDVKGIRQIIVRKDGSDDTEVVHVGTIMIQNGYAYVAGKVISGEEPNHFLDKIYFPPFVITFPPVSSDAEAKEHYEKNKDKIRADLVRAIETHNYVPAKFRCLEFEFEFDGEPDLSEQNLCGVCKGQIYEGGYEFCEDCGDTLMEYYSCKNHREVSALIALKTDGKKVLDDGEGTNAKGLRQSTLPLPNKQVPWSTEVERERVFSFQLFMLEHKLKLLNAQQLPVLTARSEDWQNLLKAMAVELPTNQIRKSNHDEWNNLEEYQNSFERREAKSKTS